MNVSLYSHRSSKEACYSAAVTSGSHIVYEWSYNGQELPPSSSHWVSLVLVNIYQGTMTTFQSRAMFQNDWWHSYLVGQGIHLFASSHIDALKTHTSWWFILFLTVYHFKYWISSSSSKWLEIAPTLSRKRTNCPFQRKLHNDFSEISFQSDSCLAIIESISQRFCRSYQVFHDTLICRQITQSGWKITALWLILNDLPNE